MWFHKRFAESQIACESPHLASFAQQPCNPGFWQGNLQSWAFQGGADLLVSGVHHRTICTRSTLCCGHSKLLQKLLSCPPKLSCQTSPASRQTTRTRAAQGASVFSWTFWLFWKPYFMSVLCQQCREVACWNQLFELMLHNEGSLAQSQSVPIGDARLCSTMPNPRIK